MTEPIDERSYILVSNMTKLRIAENVIRDLFPGEEYGIDEKRRTEVLMTLFNAINKLEKIIDD